MARWPSFKCRKVQFEFCYYKTSIGNVPGRKSQLEAELRPGPEQGLGQADKTSPDRRFDLLSRAQPEDVISGYGALEAAG